MYCINLGVAAVSKALPANATSSSIYKSEYAPEHAIDGIVDSGYNIFIGANETYPWLQVELINIVDLQSIQIFNRANCCGDRLRDIEVRAGTTKTSPNFRGRIINNAECGTFTGPGADGVNYNITCHAPIRANVVTIQIVGSDVHILQISEVEFFHSGKFIFKEVSMWGQFMLAECLFTHSIQFNYHKRRTHLFLQHRTAQRQLQHRAGVRQPQQVLPPRQVMLTLSMFRISI